MRRRSTGFTLIELLIVVAIIGIIAAIAIPSLLRARVSANESATIGDIRTVVSAEAAYHAASGGYYGTLPCMVVPSGSGCIPNYPPNAPTFLDSQIGSAAPKSGYGRTMDESAALANGLACYVYSATPLNPGQTGVRGLAADCSGVICSTSDGTAVPTTANARMISSCSVVQ
jgi:prepilin-type N-terminal cleavage/methylation domain-containing protein